MVTHRLMGHYAPPLATDRPEQHLTYGGLNPNLALFSGVLKATTDHGFLIGFTLDKRPSEYEG